MGYYRYNLYRQQSGGAKTGTDAIFDPGGSALPANGVLPEQAVALSNARSRKARLWRKVYYLQYLRELYRRTYADYYQDYYYGIDNTGKYGRLTRKDEEEER